MIEPPAGLAAADARLGRPMPLPGAPLPLARWTEVRLLGDGAEVEWNLDDTRPGTPGRLALYAGRALPPRAWPGEPADLGGFAYRTADLAGADPSLTPVHELTWEREGLALRLTAQGPWERADLVAIAASVLD